MKFQKTMDGGNLHVPGGIMKLSGLEMNEKLEIHGLKSAVVILKQQMSAMELIQAADALHRLSIELLDHLAGNCGQCEDCDHSCPLDDLAEGMLELPEYLREEAGIPIDAKLCACVDPEGNTVTLSEAGYRYDLRDVLPYLLDMLDEAGICMGELEDRLITEELVYGE